jgi:hypothetical protein
MGVYSHLYPPFGWYCKRGWGDPHATCAMVPKWWNFKARIRIRRGI